MKFAIYEKEPVYENEIKNNPMFWSYYFRYAFCQNNDSDACQEIIDFAGQHYPLDEDWAEEFARPRTDSEKMTAPKENYVRRLVYFPKGSLKWNANFNIHYIRFYQDKIVYSGTNDIEEAKKESLSRMSFQIYKKAVRACGLLSGILMVPMVYVKEGEMPEFKNLIRRGLEEITLENPRVHISSSKYGASHTISASNISSRFNITGNTYRTESLQRYIDNGGTLIVFYYKHSRVVERICNEDYDILMGNTVYYHNEY